MCVYKVNFKITFISVKDHCFHIFSPIYIFSSSEGYVSVKSESFSIFSSQDVVFIFSQENKSSNFIFSCFRSINYLIFINMTCNFETRSICCNYLFVRELFRIKRFFNFNWIYILCSTIFYPSLYTII